jgi:predicted nucleic acid-binding protein
VPETFVDAVAWIAMINTRDGLHSRTWQEFDALEKRKGGLVTTEFVLLEVADALSSPALRRKTVPFLNALR